MSNDNSSYKFTLIGKIPKDWEVVELGEICKIESGDTAPQKKEYFENGKYPFIRMQHLNDLEENKYPKKFDLINEKAIKEKKFKLFQKGCILLAKSGESIRTEKKAILKFDSYVVNHLAVISIEKREKIDNEYLFYFLSRFKLSSLLSQTTTPSINLSILKKIKVILPPLPEQKAIAQVLSTVDEAIQKVDEIIAKTERLKKGLMQQLLTGKIRVKEVDGKLTLYKETEFKDTEIGKIPKDWEVVKLGDVVEVWDNYRIPVKEQNRKRGNYPYCGANGIIDYVDGFTHDGKFILLAEDGGYFGPYENSAYIMQGKFWANNHVHILKTINRKIIDEFLMFYLNFVDLRPFLTGSTRPKLTQREMLMIPIPKPPVREQQKIVLALISIEEKLELGKKRKEKLERIKKGLMNDLLTGRKRMKI